LVLQALEVRIKACDFGAEVLNFSRHSRYHCVLVIKQGLSLLNFCFSMDLAGCLCGCLICKPLHVTLRPLSLLPSSIKRRWGIKVDTWHLLYH